jgi:hypothetical protein
MRSFNEGGWSRINALRAEVESLSHVDSLEEAAGGFVECFARTFESLVLARMFLVTPLSALPISEQQLVSPEGRLPPTTSVLSLLATRGRKPAWNQRTASAGHRNIALVSAERVAQAPMIAKLLGDLKLDLRGLDAGLPIATRQLLGGHNGTFFVPDAQTATDEQGRPIISPAFAEEHGVRTVFGMGGAYMDGTIVVAILFCDELLDRCVVERFPSFIGSFKTVTTRLVGQRRLFAATTR